MEFAPTLHKLSNGVTVILDPMDIESASVKVLFRTSNRDEAPHEYGITHFCEHMLCKGTARFPTQRDLLEYLEYNGTAKMSDSITCDDVIENSRGYFDGPMSIVTQGADFSDDLQAIWLENFK